MQGLAKAVMLGVAVLAISGCASLRTEISRERSLLDADKRYAEMSVEQGASATMQAMMAPQTSMLARPEGEYLGAGQAAQAFPLRPGQGDVLYWEADKAWVSADDNLGVTTGRYVRTQNGVQIEQGRYATVWRRDAVGDWKAELALANIDAPRAPPPPPPVTTAPPKSQPSPPSSTPSPRPQPAPARPR